MIVFGFQLSPGLVDACGAAPGWACRVVYEATESSGLARAADWLVDRPAKILLILVVAFILNRLVRRAIARGIDRWVGRIEQEREVEVDQTRSGPLGSLQEFTARKIRSIGDRTERSKQRARTLDAVLRSVSAFVIYGLALLLALAQLDINLGPLIAGAGVAGIALGFGAQALVRDFLSGTFMLLEDQYGVGDVVNVGEATGTVEAVSLRTTRLRDVRGVVWHVPNGEIRRVGNLTQLWARVVLDIEVAYDTDLDLAARVIKEAADGLWREQVEDATILEEPEVWGVEQFGENSIAIRLAAKVEPAEQWKAARVIRRRIKEAFDREGIEIPFPQRTVWVHQSGARAVPPGPAGITS